MELLPNVPDWKVKKISITSYLTREPMFLFYHDSLDCVEYLLGNPLFSDCMDFCPVRFYQDVEQTIRIYTEWLSADAAWETQVRFFHMITGQPILITVAVVSSRRHNSSQHHPFI